MNKKFKHVLFQVEQANDLFKHRGLIKPDYDKVLQALINSMQPLVIMDDSGTQLDVFKTYGNFGPFGMKISFVCFYWRALQFFIRWHAYVANSPNGLSEERTETLVTESFVYLTYITDVLKEDPSIYYA